MQPLRTAEALILKVQEGNRDYKESECLNSLLYHDLS